MTKKRILLLSAILLSGCASGADILSQLKLEDGETGSVCVRGVIDMNASIFVTSNASVVYKEVSGDFTEPDC